MKKTIHFFVGMAGLAICINVNAAVSSAVHHPSISSFYISANAGYGMSEGVVSRQMRSSYKKMGIAYKRNRFVWKAGLGYQISNQFAFEAGYAQLPGEEHKQVGQQNADKSIIHAIYLNARVSYPLSTAFNLYGLIGYDYQDVKFTGDNGKNYEQRLRTWGVKTHMITPMYGVGMNYALNKSIALSLEADSTLRTSIYYPATYAALFGVSYSFS